MINQLIKHIKILVIDDFSSTRRIIKKMLTESDFKNVIEAKDGKEAMEILKKDSIDFIFCDWNMPNMSGMELLKKIKEDEILNTIPFVLVTAEATKSCIIEAVSTGVTTYIIKPFTKEELLTKIEQITRD